MVLYHGLVDLICQKWEYIEKKNCAKIFISYSFILTLALLACTSSQNIHVLDWEVHSDASCLELGAYGTVLYLLSTRNSGCRDSVWTRGPKVSEVIDKVYTDYCILHFVRGYRLGLYAL
jgi:hypothetical protein